jgi:hypothetical protein
MQCCAQSGMHISTRISNEDFTSETIRVQIAIQIRDSSMWCMASMPAAHFLDCRGRIAHASMDRTLFPSPSFQLSAFHHPPTQPSSDPLTHASSPPAHFSHTSTQSTAQIGLSRPTHNSLHGISVYSLVSLPYTMSEGKANHHCLFRAYINDHDTQRIVTQRPLLPNTYLRYLHFPWRSVYG